jgi:hypothetical protein
LALLTILGTIRFFVNNAEKRHKEKIQMINQEKEVELHNAKIHFFTTIAQKFGHLFRSFWPLLKRLCLRAILFPNPLRKT